MAASKPVPNGSAEAPIEVSSIPAVVGINFGNSYASIAVFTKEGLAECIANEDGERQIACAVAFHGEEIYIGNQAKHQLIKNSHNTITGFRNLLGKKFSEIPQNEHHTSAPVIQHPDQPDEPAYKVAILQPAPLPLPATATNTPAVSHAPTPRSEPIHATRILTVSEVTSMFLKSLVQSAADFLGKPILGAVISVPSWFTTEQKSALLKTAEDAGVNVLQLLDEAGAVAATTTTELWRSSSGLHVDRTQLVVDLGASSLALTLLSIRDGLAHILAASSHADVTGDQLDDKLIKFFAKEFTKKTKTPLKVCPASHHDKRPEAKLRLAVQHTKRTLSASPGAATCSVESLKDGLDFTGSINRMRFDMEARPIYAAVAVHARALLADAGVDGHSVDEIVYVGGSTCLPGLDEHLCLEGGFDTDAIDTPFGLGTIAGGGVGDPTEVLARGCALQAALLYGLGEEGEDVEVKKAFEEGSAWTGVGVVGRTIGLLFPGSDGDEFGLGGTWIPVVLKETGLPARRTVAFDVALSESSTKFGFELWEVEEGVESEMMKPPKVELPEEDDGEGAEAEEEEEEVEVKRKTVKKAEGGYLGRVEAEAKKGVRVEDIVKTRVKVRLIVGKEGGIVVEAREVGERDAGGRLVVPAI